MRGVKRIAIQENGGLSRINNATLQGLDYDDDMAVIGENVERMPYSARKDSRLEID